jgi:hypothetical protein
LHHFSSKDGVIAYDEYFYQLTRYQDRAKAFREGDIFDDELKAANPRSPLQKIRSSKDPSKRLTSSQYPSLNAFPTYDWDKPSKMPLTSLPEIPKDTQDIFRSTFERFILDIDLPCLEVPKFNAWVHCAGSKYADGHLIKDDSEKPEITWEGPMIYQSFWTSPISKREVWLPSKSYKMASTYWHLISEQFVEKVPEMVGNEDMESIAKSVLNRMRKCIELDLKGFGIQFPRSLLKIAIETISKIYPNDENNRIAEYTIKLLDDLRVLMPDGSTLKPSRGKGLGYFETLAALCICAIMKDADAYLVKMFHDDILVDYNDADKAIASLEFYGLVLKPERETWYYTPYFLNCMIVKQVDNKRLDKKTTYLIKWHQSNAAINAVCTQRYHFERKGLFLSNVKRDRYKMAFHYVRCFGYEYSPLEVYNHPNEWGLNPDAPELHGWVKGGALRKFRMPKMPDVLKSRLASYYFPFSDRKVKSKFSAVRKKAKKLLNTVKYTWFDEYLHPEGEEAPWLFTNFDKGFFQTSNTYTPYWYDLRMLLRTGYTTGRALRSLDKKTFLDFLVRFAIYDDPVGVGKSGGLIYNGQVPMKQPSLDEEKMALYNAVFTAKQLPPLIADKVIPELPEPYEAQVDNTNETLEWVRKSLLDSMNQEDSPEGITEDDIIQQMEAFLLPDAQEIPREEIVSEEEDFDIPIEDLDFDFD